MKATDILSFIKVSENVIEDKKKELYNKILDVTEECAEMFALSQEDLSVIRTYCTYYQYKPIFLYNQLNNFAIEDGKAFVRIWISDGEGYIIEPTELPKGYFKSLITVLNYE